MAKQSNMFAYTIGKKFIMALSGLFLVVFLIEHLIGNSLMYAGEEAFNGYAEFMGHNIFIRVAEVVLFLGFLTHIVDAIYLTGRNSSARPVKYKKKTGKEMNFFSRWMGTTGTIILIFLILHLVSFFAQARFGLDVNFGADGGDYNIAYGKEDFSLYLKAKTLFEIPWYTIFYAVSMLFLSFHLLHAFESAFQSLGLRHPKYTPVIKAVGKAYAILVPAALAAVPLYFLISKYAA